MKEISFPYGKEILKYSFKEEELVGVLESSIEDYKPDFSEEELVKRAIENPVGSPKLSELAKDKQNIVIIASDHTRPVPSKVIMPAIFKEIRSVNPNAKITVLIATGCHRGTTKEELVSKFGEEFVNSQNIYIHDCDEKEKLINIGKLPSGGDCEINSIAMNSDLLIAEGFIEPHFFAGYSGGRKSVLPGVAARKTVLYNHNAAFIDAPGARTGVLENNPIHEDMLYAARAAHLAFICNVVINSEKQVICAVAGDAELAHAKGREFLCSQCMVERIPSDIVITTNGGYPLDQSSGPVQPGEDRQEGRACGGHRGGLGEL